MSNTFLFLLSCFPGFLCGVALGSTLSFMRAYREIVIAGIGAIVLKNFVEYTGGYVGTPFYATCIGLFTGIIIGAIIERIVICIRIRQYLIARAKYLRSIQPRYPLLPPMLALAIVLASSPATASTADAIAHMCDDGKFDQYVQNNRSAFEQDLLAHAHTISTQYPIASAMSSCVQKLTNTIASLPNHQNPLSAGNSLNASIINSIVQNTCSAALDTITSAQGSVLNMSKICLPLPNFSLSVETPTFNALSCSGSFEYSTMTGFVAPSASIYTYYQYQQ